MKKILGTSLAIVLCAAMVTGCGSSTPSTPETSSAAPSAASSDAAVPEAKSITIGFSSKTNSDTFVKSIADAAQKEADASGVKLIMADAAGDVNKQISDVENMIAQKVDVIVVIPQDIEGSAPVVAMAKEAGIPIVICNGDVSDKTYTAFVGCTDQESGEILGKWFNENLEKGSKVCIIEGPMGQSGQVGRYAGFKAVGTLDNFEVLSTQTANWKRDEALALTEDWLTTYGADLKGIICENDDMALGALSAAKAAGRTDIVIGGVDGLDDAVAAVKAGEIGVSVLQDSSGQGVGSIKIAIQIAKGEAFSQDTRIPFKAITKDNVDAYLKDGVSALG